MALRLLHVVVPDDDRERALELFEEASVEPHAEHELTSERRLLEAVLEANASEELLDELEKAFEGQESFRIVLLPVEASLPRRQEDEEEADAGAGEETKKGAGLLKRVSREELSTDLREMSEIDGTYLLLSALSSVVAAVGLLHDNVAAIVGAMVIAPLLGPLVTMAFATTLADLDLGWKGLRAGIVGSAIGLGLAACIGLLTRVEPSMPQILPRTELGYSDMVLALAAGSAGVLSMTGGVAEALVGVMVAVALLPALVTVGLLVGAGFYAEAGTAFLAFMAYAIGINLAGVVTFLAQGVRPRTFWEASRAKKATRWAILVWLVLLAGLVVAVALLGE